MTGLGNYSRLVISSVAERYHGDDIDIFTPRFSDNERFSAIISLPNVSVITPKEIIRQKPGDSSRSSVPLSYSGPGGALWRTLGISRMLRDRNLDVYHGLSNELPLNIRSAGVASVVTVHDIIYRRLPHCYNLPDRILYDFKYGRSCRNAERIIAISERTKLDIMEFYGVPEDKIDVIYQGCDDIFRRPVEPTDVARVRREMALPEHFILQVGTIESRKNLELTVRALSALPKKIHLVAVGRDRKGYAQKVRDIARKTGVADRLMILDRVGFRDLPVLYSAAMAAAYPSRYEGFGLPVVEAMAAGCPVAAATGSCLEEAGGNAAIYVDPDDPKALAEALRALSTHSHERDRRIAEGRKHTSVFTNSDIAEKIMQTYIHAIRTHNNTPQND